MGIDIGGHDTGRRNVDERDTGERADRLGEERARAAVLEVTRTMLHEVGYQHLRVEQVAARAGVPRVWLRRWWTTRPLLVAEALQRMGGPTDIVPTGDVRTDIRAVVLRTAAFLANPVVGDALAGLAADAARDPVAAERLTALLGARRSGDAAVLLSAIARGDLRYDTDVPLVLDLVFGTLLFRLAGGIRPTPAVVDTLVDLVVDGQATRVPQPAHGQGRDGTPLDGRGLDGRELDALRLDGQGRDWEGRHGRGLDGFRLDGHAVDGHAVDGYGVDGYGVDGHGVDGHGVDGHEVDGHAVDGHAVDGHAFSRHGRHQLDGHGDGASQNGASQNGARQDHARGDTGA